ncbi:Uncharacterised protein [Mycobacteroides abscessus subsp. abscessus]|nr:Uncharacterised protein [Mycobacteroides abscessus subsp. abscessus]SHR48064.1 Uncharacterised protein [Mycobacteroides abscessus subsp. abscessus]SHS20904.1 Uncharacterised protein [Mycobacteroides abscessus subsp. abscessus]SHS25202.1 Uncharacterised protein [Mycobacteroides abscessus subsp. abscessus]SHT59793.1 Uncharacterised protein [Mycobacteroides abscessus subsp. abscessus]
MPDPGGLPEARPNRQECDRSPGHRLSSYRGHSSPQCSAHARGKTFPSLTNVSCVSLNRSSLHSHPGGDIAPITGLISADAHFPRSPAPERRRYRQHTEEPVRQHRSTARLSRHRVFTAAALTATTLLMIGTRQRIPARKSVARTARECQNVAQITHLDPYLRNERHSPFVFTTVRTDLRSQPVDPPRPQH